MVIRIGLCSLLIIAILMDYGSAKIFDYDENVDKEFDVQRIREKRQWWQGQQNRGGFAQNQWRRGSVGEVKGPDVAKRRIVIEETYVKGGRARWANAAQGRQQASGWNNQRAQGWGQPGWGGGGGGGGFNPMGLINGIGQMIFGGR